MRPPCYQQMAWWTPTCPPSYLRGRRVRRTSGGYYCLLRPLAPFCSGYDTFVGGPRRVEVYLTTSAHCRPPLMRTRCISKSRQDVFVGSRNRLLASHSRALGYHVRVVIRSFLHVAQGDFPSVRTKGTRSFCTKRGTQDVDSEEHSHFNLRHL